MKLTEIFQRNTPCLSFEVFPPTSHSLFETMEQAILEIADLHPSFMSVTYGAGGGTSTYTLETAKRIQEKVGVPTLAHLTCVSSTKDGIRSQIQKLKEAKIENVLALRGDIPEELENRHHTQWDYLHAVDLIHELKESNADFCIGGACYPEIHPESINQKEDLKWLKEKVDAGCDFLTTQMVFDNNLLYNFLYKAREAGITVPIIPGIMPIINRTSLVHALELSHAFVPQAFKALVDKFGDNPATMRQAGIIYATYQIIDLYANGIKNVHVYSMNHPDVAREIQRNVSAIIGK